jgi:conjugal transfer/entry exclusion protein
MVSLTKRVFKKQQIAQEEYDELARQSRGAQDALENEYLMPYLENTLAMIEEKILNNTIRDTTESVTVTQNIVRKFFQPKREQIDQLTGQYRFVQKLLADLRLMATKLKEVDDRLSKDEITIK